MPVTTRSQKRRKVVKYDGYKQVKLLHGSMTHYGFRWKEGLNVLRGPFNYDASCGPGGLYYCNAKDVKHHVEYMDPLWIADVTIPNNAKTVHMKTKSKSDQVILSNVRYIDSWSALDDTDYASSLFSYIPEHKKTLDICLEAVKKDGWALMHVPEDKKTIEIYLEAVKQNGLSLCEVPEDKKTLEICLEAVTRDAWALQYVPEDKKTVEICLKAVKRHGCSLKYVPKDKKTIEVCLEAVKNDKWARIYTPEDKYREVERLLNF